MCQTLIAIDIITFGDPRRDTDHQIRIRATLYDLVIKALAITGVPWPACYHEDRGDGILIIVPADITPCLLLDPFAHHLDALLRKENRYIAPQFRLRLRIAAHRGHVEHDRHGIAGRAVVDLFRHLDAPAFKRLITAAADADLGLIVTQALFQEATQRGGLVHHDAYHAIRIVVKEVRAQAWAWLPPRHTGPEACNGGLSAT